MVRAGTRAFPGHVALAELGDARRRRLTHLLSSALSGARRRRVRQLRRAPGRDARARAPAVAAVAHFAGHFRHRLGGAVHRPRDRGQAPVVLQGPAVLACRAAVAAGGGLSKLARPVLATALQLAPAASRTAAATFSCTCLSSGSGTSSSPC